MDCVVHGVTESWTRLSDFHSHLDQDDDEEAEEFWRYLPGCIDKGLRKTGRAVSRVRPLDVNRGSNTCQLCDVEPIH